MKISWSLCYQLNYLEELKVSEFYLKNVYISKTTTLDQFQFQIKLANDFPKKQSILFSRHRVWEKHVPSTEISFKATSSCLYLNSILDKLMIVTVLIRYKSWQSQIFLRSCNFYCFTIFFLLVLCCALLYSSRFFILFIYFSLFTLCT